MAKYGKSLAQVVIEINGKKQAEQVLKAMQSAARDLEKSIKAANTELEQLAQSGGGPEYDAKHKEIVAMQQELKQLNKAIGESKKFSQDIGSILDNMSDNNVTVLNRTKRSLEALLSSIVPNTKKAQKQIEQLQKAIRQVTDEIDRRKGKITEFEDIMNNLGKATPKQLDAVEKRLQTLLESVTKNSNAWRKYDKQMRLLQEEKGRRTAAQAQDIMSGNYTKTTEGTRKAIELLKKYQDTLNTTDSSAIDAVTTAIKKMNAELETAARERAEKVMKNPFAFSTEEINEAIKYTEKLQASTPDPDAWHEYAKQLAEAKRARDEFAEISKHKVMVEQFSLLEKISANALAEQKKYWESMRDSGQYFDEPIKNLEKISALEQKRLKESAGKVMGGDYTRTIEGTQQAIKLLEKYQSTLDVTDTKAIDKVTESIKKMNAELETAARERAEKVMRNPTGFSPEQIDEAIKFTEKLQKATPDGKQWTDYARQIETAKEARDKFASDAKFEIMSEQFKQFYTLSKEAAEQQTKYWEGLGRSMAETDPRYQTVLDNIQKIKDLSRTQLENDAFKIMGGEYTHTIEGTKQAIEILKKYQQTLDATDASSINSVNEAIREMNSELDTAAKNSARETLTANLKFAGTEDIKQAVEWLTRYQGTLEPLSQEWRDVNKEIEAGNERLKSISDRTKLEAMTNQFRNLNKLSAAALSDQQKYWQSVLDGAQKGTAAYIQAERKLQTIRQEITSRNEAQAGAVMGGLANHSVAEIQEAIKMTEQLRDAQKAGSVEYEIYNNEIKQAKEYLQNYIDLNKQADMEDKWRDLTILSSNALAEQKKYWQEMVNGAKQGSQELQYYQSKLKEVVEEEQFRLDNKYIKVMNNPDQYSVRELEEAIKHFEKLRDEQRLGSGEWDYYASKVNRASEQLKAFKDSTKLDAMEKQFANLSNLSVNAFAEQKKYWESMRNSLESTDPLYAKAIDNLRQINDLENNRTKSDAEQAIFDVKFGYWDKTIEETQQAIKLIEEYKKQLKTKSDADAIEEANKAITELNANLGKAKESLMSVQDAINIGRQIKDGQFDGTTEDILRAKKALEEYRKTLKQKTDADVIKVVDDALRNVTNSAEQAKKKLVDIDKVLDSLDSASVEDLQAAAKQLQDQLEGAERGVGDYTRLADKLRDINLELKKAKKEWEGQENVIMRTAKRLAAYVAVYGGFNAVSGYLKRAFDANLQLSDSFADVQKTTGLADDEIKELSRDINSIDTRTAQLQLHELAATAGQIGLKSEEDVLGFVKASNMITVSLNELGSEGTASLMKLAQLTGDVKNLGVEKSLLAIGSAINELSANSSATAGPIVELMRRMGGIASQSNITTAEMAAIGATADAIGQSMEITGTSMNKFIATLLSNSDQIAYALNMDAKALNDAIAAGQTMEAMLMVLEKMGDMGGISKLAPVMGDLGSEGARMTQMLSAMAKNVDFLREQVNLSRDAFEDAISIENEYNIKNENAIALLERMGNTLSEMWVNSAFVSGLTSVLKHLNNFVNWLAEGDTGARILKASLIALSVTISLASMHLDKFAKALFKAKTYTELFSGSWEKLGKLLKKNWISILAGALLSLWYYLKQTADFMTELTRATSQYNAELDRENNIMKSLFNGAQNENLSKREKGKIINEINQRYGKYLDFLVSERDSVKELAAAYELANARMRESMASRMGNKQMEILDERFGEKMSENRTNLMTKLEEGKNIAGREKDAMAAIRRITMDNLDKDVKDIRILISNEFQRLFGQSSAFASTEIKNYIETQKEYYKEFEIINEEAAQDLEQAQKATAEANVRVMEEMFNQVQDLNSGVVKESTEGAFKSALDIQRGIVQEGEQFINYANSQLENLSEEQRQKVQKNIKLVETQINEARKNLPEGDPWGKEGNLKGWKNTLDNLSTASVDSLVSTYKELRDAPKLITDVMKYNRMFGTSFSSLGEVMEDTHDKAEQIKNQLASMGRTTTGDFLWGGSGGRKQKDEYEAALASLEAYYNDREEVVRKNALFEETTQEELDKRLQSLEQEHLSARIELRKLMLNKENSFLTMFNHAAESEYMQGIDYHKLQNQLDKLGKAMAQGLEKNLTEDMVSLQKIAWAHQEEISKILLENDPVKKVAMEYQKSFEKLDMFWSADENRTKESAREKMATLLDFSTRRSELSDEDMRKQLEESKQFSQIVKTMTAEDFQAFLILLEQYAEAATNAKRQATQKAVRNLEFGFDNSDLGKQVSGQLQNIEDIQGQLGEMQSSGLTMDASALKKRKELIEQRIALEQLKWATMIETEKNGMNRHEVLQDLMLEKDKKTYQGRLEVMELMMDMDARMFEESSSRIDQMQGWGAVSEINATERKRDLIYAELALQQMRIDEMIRIEEEGQNRMGVIENLRMARQDSLYKADRRLTELTMQEYRQRTQIANEWGTAIGNGLGEMIAGTEDAGKALVKNLATMAVQSIGQMAQMYVAKQLLLSQQNMAEAASAMTTATTAAAEATAVGAAKTAEATAIAMATPDSVLTFGASGAAKAAVISGLIAAAVAASIAIINSLFPGAGDKANAKTRRLSTGMLTYAEGNYPVLGNDGKVYDAKYEGAGLKTGVYGGGAHFGIFSEKQPEMIVDGKTTQKLILNYPYIYDAITTIAKNGRLKNAMPTFAAGDYPAGMKRIAQMETADASAGSNEDMIQMRTALEETREVNRQLLKLLQGGIAAHLDGLETYRQQKKNERFLKRRGID